MPDTRITCTIPLTVTLTSPLHHGAGTSGNVQILREQPAINPHTGEEFQTPFVSGVTLRRALREACTTVTLTAIDAEPGGVSKPVVDLLVTGGALTAGENSEVPLERHRRLDAAWPAAGLFGYAGVGALWPGSLYVDHLLPICSENQWRLPRRLAHHPHTRVPVAALVEEDFGTSGTGMADDAARWAEAAWRAEPMPFEFQVIRPGTVLYGGFELQAATVEQAAMLRHVWDLATADGTIRLGGGRARGYGACTVETHWPDSMPDPAPGITPEGLAEMLVETAGR